MIPSSTTTRNGHSHDKSHRTIGLQQSDLTTPWERRTETTSARERRVMLETERERQHLEDIAKEKSNSIEQFIVSPWS